MEISCFISFQLGLHGYTGYSASKFGLRGLAEVLQMEVKPYNIGVSISFPPDTNTPQLQAELGERDAIQNELASFGTIFEADVIARDIWNSVERGVFLIHHGLDGFMLATITAGMSPVHRLWDATAQVCTAWGWCVMTHEHVHKLWDATTQVQQFWESWYRLYHKVEVSM